MRHKAASLLRIFLGVLITSGVLLGSVFVGAFVAVENAQPVAAVQLPVFISDDLREQTSEVDDLQIEIVDALAASKWPRLRPPVPAVTRWSPLPPDVEACGETGMVEPLAGCTWGDPDGTRHAVVVGDSIAMAYVEALRTAFAPGTGWQVTALGSPGCNFIDAEVLPEVPAYAERCPRVQARALRTIEELQPEVVFVAQVVRASRVVGGPVSYAAWAKLVSRALGELPASSQVVVLGRPPSEKELNRCFAESLGPDVCVSTVTEEWQRKRESEQAVARAVGGTFVDSEPWFCSRGSCPAFVGSVPTKADLLHMSRAYARVIGPAMWESLREVLPDPVP